MSLLPEIEIKKDELLRLVKNNRDVHVKEYNEIMESRRKEIHAYISKMISDIESKASYQPDILNPFPMPSNYKAEYDRAIKMLEMSVNDTIVLYENQFDQLVMDNWSWKGSFRAVSASYK